MLASLIISGAGVIGTGLGVYVAALFVPTLAMLLKSTLDFLRSPVGMIAGAMVGAFLLYVVGWVGGDLHGSNQTRAAWRAADIAAAKARLANETAIRVEMKKVADQQVFDVYQFTKSLAAKVATHDSETVFNSARRATADDIRRLLQITYP
jgi:hypothetical protein